MENNRDHDVTDAVGDAAENTKDAAGNAADVVRDKAKSGWNKTTDAVEELIPGDSDRDGH